MWPCKKTANRSPLRRSQCGMVCRLGIWKRCYRRLSARLHPQRHSRSPRRLLACPRAPRRNGILRAAGTIDETEEELNSELVAKVLLPVLSAVEQECGQALSRISLDDIVNRVALNGHGTAKCSRQLSPRSQRHSSQVPRRVSIAGGSLMTS